MDIPVYKMTLDPNNPKLGMKFMSMVGSPAIMVNCVKFSEDKRVKLSVSENRIFGPALIPDLPIYRTMNGKEFYLTIDAETIEQFHLKACNDTAYKNLDVDHSNQLIQGVTIDTMFRSDDMVTLNNPEFAKFPKGTLFLGGKMTNPDIIAKVNSGEINGWSIDAMFSFEPLEVLTEKEINSVIKEVLNSL